MVILGGGQFLVSEVLCSATRWATKLSSKVNLHHVIHLRDSRGAVTSIFKVKGEHNLRSPPSELVHMVMMVARDHFTRTYLTERVFGIVLPKAIPAQIRQLILYISNHRGYVDGFVGELTFAKRLYTNTFCEIRTYPNEERDGSVDQLHRDRLPQR